MRTRVFPVMLAALFLGAPLLASAVEMTVRVDARDVARKHLHTDITLEVPAGPITLVFPQWIPGEHEPSGPIDTLIGMVIRAGGKVLTWQRDPVDMYAISVEVPAGATQLEIALDSGLPTGQGSFTAGPTSSEQLAVLSWNQVVLLPKGRDADTISTEASVLAPPGWTLACALDLHALGDGSTHLEGASLARLIDSPLQMGHFAKRIEVAGAAPLPQLKHAISIVADSETALAVPDDFAAGYGRMVAQAGMLFGSRMYRHYTWLLSLSDQVAHFGLEHHESSDDRTDENSLSSPPLRERVAELMAHEYVHSWNGKYRRPAGLLSPDYQKPMEDGLLWVYEGMTQFWGEVLPVRSGITSVQSYQETLAAEAGVFDIETGARWRPLADTAVSAPMLYEAPAIWEMSRRGADFYAASEFLWLNVDAELRARSGGKACLDDFVKRFYAGEGGHPAVKPYVEEDVYAGLSAVVPADWRQIIRRHLDTLGPEAVLAGLQSTGWQLSYSAVKNSYLEVDQRRRKTTNRLWSLGLLLDKDDTVVDAVEDLPAARAGIGPGMKLVAVNGRRFTAEVLDEALVAAHDSRKPIELLVENGEFYRTVSVPYFDGPRWPHITRITGERDVLAEVLRPRTH